MRKDIPTGAEATRKAENFKKFLNDRGAELLATTNEWEVVRFRTGKGISVLYRKKNDSLPCSDIGEALKAWREFTNPGSTWRAIPATKRKRHSNAAYDTLIKRDGILCFFCAQPMTSEDCTIEHLVPLAHGGPQHVSNKFLAHTACNNEAGTLSAPEKVAIYHRVRLNRYIRGHSE